MTTLTDIIGTIILFTLLGVFLGMALNYLNIALGPFAFTLVLIFVIVMTCRVATWVEDVTTKGP